MKKLTNEKRPALTIVASRFFLALLLVFVGALCANIAKANTIFSDDFTSSTLNPAWQVLSGEGSYTVGGGSLRYFDDGPVASTTGWYNATLTLALPIAGTNWERSTRKPPTS